MDHIWIDCEQVAELPWLDWPSILVGFEGPAEYSRGDRPNMLEDRPNILAEYANTIGIPVVFTNSGHP